MATPILTQPTRNIVAAAIVPDVKPLLRRPAIEQVTGDSRSTIYRKIERGLFPKPVCTGRDKNGDAIQVGWPANEVAAINAARIAGKSEDEIRKLVTELEAARIACTKG
ncbi:AlpA family phage regulatory protein [Methylomicrobium sp. Wu6]|uniref:helix-turn-helix transcriptional regulator n=1 Tax=Methylomicrobium sp. Wu6 TaxID=3107928 RepID=UPI002DD6331F|nr:AlpA family phage regulatory protein [Methylomicrobium sp. Wu6]MEC4747893.1 AlpA family phage regulatory protein [Methylomicrobium sp. Wu6]